jgi:hypothetical protein
MASTTWSTGIRESLYVYPLVESTHVLSIMLFVGLAIMLDLRLLGITLRDVPVTDMLDRVLPWTKLGFAIMVITGVLLFFAIPVRTYQNIFFRTKILLLLLAGLNAWRFHSRTGRDIVVWDRHRMTPAAARVAGAASIVLWAGVVVTGRMIAYNWFDCDIQPQPAFINWAAGCVVAPPQ